MVALSALSFCNDLDDSPKDLAVCLSHDLSMLRLVETFSESAPQLVLMLTIILRRNQLYSVTGVEKNKQSGGQHFSFLIHLRIS